MAAISNGELETASEMAAALAAGGTSSLELVERALARAEAWQPATNALSQPPWAEEGLAAAHAADAARRAGDAGPLAGIPIAVKDLFDVAGHVTTGCSRAYADRALAAADAPMVAAVRAAGLVLIGKLNQHELAAGGTNLVSACGRTANPFDPERMTGGSSGGSAAAVAAGIVPWTLGSDTGGSIRIPSSMCGVYGLKPTTGRLSIRGMLPLAPSLDCPGPIAATGADLAILFAVLHGRDPGTAVPRPPPAAAVGRRVGVPEGYLDGVVHPEAGAAVEAVAAMLGGAGAEVVRLDGHGIEDARSVWNRVCWSEFGPAHPALADPARRALLDPSVREWIERGEALSPEERERAAARREEIGEWFRDRLGGVDALVVPTTPYPAPRADQEEVDLGPAGTVRVARIGPGYLTSAVNLAGLPALSLPAAWSSEGLPIGVSLIGHDDGEATLLELAAVWEAGGGHRPRRPQRPAQ